MKVYQINYDLRKQRNYDALYQKIKAYGAWCHPLESCWIVASHKTAVEIRDDLGTAIDNDDGLLITRLQGEAAWYNLDDKGSQVVANWLKSNLGSAT
ncbi:TPA: hypothetical protein ACNFOO_003232 [Acinetobacter baumannii]